jgi:hypothetical protein
VWGGVGVGNVNVNEEAGGVVLEPSGGRRRRRANKCEGLKIKMHSLLSSLGLVSWHFLWSFAFVI